MTSTKTVVALISPIRDLLHNCRLRRALPAPLPSCSEHHGPFELSSPSKSWPVRSIGKTPPSTPEHGTGHSNIEITTSGPNPRDLQKAGASTKRSRGGWMRCLTAAHPHHIEVSIAKSFVIRCAPRQRAEESGQDSAPRGFIINTPRKSRPLPPPGEVGVSTRKSGKDAYTGQQTRSGCPRLRRTVVVPKRGLEPR